MIGKNDLGKDIFLKNGRFGPYLQFEIEPELEKNLRHDIDVRIDRMRLERANRQRLTEAVEAGLRLGAGAVAIESLKAPKPRKEGTS